MSTEYFSNEVQQQAEAELAVIRSSGVENLITPIDSVFRDHDIPVRSFETARVADIEGVTREFSMRRDDLVHHAAVAELAGYDPSKVIMPVIIGDVNPVVLRERSDIVEGQHGFLVPNITDEDGNVGRSQCVVVTGNLLQGGYGLGMLVADCSVENVVVTKKDEPDNLVAIAQTHNGWRQIADGSDIALQGVFAEAGWLDKENYDIYISPSSGVAYGFEMNRDLIEGAFSQRGVDAFGKDRSHDLAWSIGPQDVAKASGAQWPEDLSHHVDPEKGFVNIALTAHLSHIISLGLQSNETAYSATWQDSLTSEDRPSDRRAQVRYKSDPEVQKEKRSYRMMVALLPEANV